MKTTITEVRNSHLNLSKEVNSRIAVIVSTAISKRKATHGVQYWTPEMITAGSSKNTDNTISTLIEKL